MSKDDLEKRMETFNEKLAMERKKLAFDILEKEARKLSNSAVRMLYCFLAIAIITLFLHLGSEFYKEFPLASLHHIMVSVTLGSYITSLMCEINSERKRFCSLDILKKRIIEMEE